MEMTLQEEEQEKRLWAREEFVNTYIAAQHDHVELTYY